MDHALLRLARHIALLLILATGVLLGLVTACSTESLPMESASDMETKKDQR